MVFTWFLWWWCPNPPRATLWGVMWHVTCHIIVMRVTGRHIVTDSVTLVHVTICLVTLARNMSHSVTSWCNATYWNSSQTHYTSSYLALVWEKVTLTWKLIWMCSQKLYFCGVMNYVFGKSSLVLWISWLLSNLKSTPAQQIMMTFQFSIY